ncbi:MAG: Hsp20/alpha crystallin family protein [Candidatus Tectimicrobiota bacterium]
MAEERQQSGSARPQGQQPQAQGQQPAGQTNQSMQRSSSEQQRSMERRRGGMPSLFNMDPFEMFKSSPFALMRRFMEDMEQWSPFGMSRSGQGTASPGGTFFHPSMEIFEREGQLVVRADLPGLTKDDVRVEVTDEHLTIEGERRSEHEGQEGGMFRSERHYGTFRRQISLPEGVNAEQATATFKDGVLEVSMPAPQRQTRSRQIEIAGETTSSSGRQNGAGQHTSRPMNQEQEHATAGRA